MEVQELRLQGLLYIKPKVYSDARGFFVETFQEERYLSLGIPGHFPQDNHSFSKKHCVRGMHFQATPGQAKLIRVGMGRIFDVAVDIRPNSPTFGEWEGIELDDESHGQLYVPVGFAHGFCVLSEYAHVLYKVSTPYHSLTEKGFRWDDPTVGIQWPIASPLVSERDRSAPFFAEIQWRQSPIGSLS